MVLREQFAKLSDHLIRGARVRIPPSSPKICIGENMKFYIQKWYYEADEKYVLGIYINDDESTLLDNRKVSKFLNLDKLEYINILAKYGGKFYQCNTYEIMYFDYISQINMVMKELENNLIMSILSYNEGANK